MRRGRGRPPAAKSADTRGRILRTAREVFGELGYDAATFQEIAVRADLTRPAINHYFPSKRELYRQVVRETNGALIEAAVVEARAYEGFADRIRVFVSSAARAKNGDHSAAAFLLTSVLESQRHPELADGDHDVLASTRNFVCWVLRDAQAAGELRPDIDTAVVVETLLAILLGVGFYAGFIGGGQRLADVTEELLRMLRCDGFIRTV